MAGQRQVGVHAGGCMIRLIYIGDQIMEYGDDEPCHDFAFYDTVLDRFMKFDDQVVFTNLTELKEALKLDSASQELTSRLLSLTHPEVLP